MTNTDRKLKIAVLFGGRSGEHEVSLMSARSVLSVLDADKYEITQVGITHDGRWFTGANALEALENETTNGLEQVIFSPDPSERGLYVLRDTQYTKLTDIDVFFPVMHGTYSEDGTMQGLLEMADVAYVGAGVVGSSVGMDKGIFKDVMVANNIPVVDTLIVLRREIEEDMEAVICRAEAMCSYPIFTKPANLGSSVGISKVTGPGALTAALDEAARHDRKILVERAVRGREIEVSVLGNDTPIASLPGEITYGGEWYDYATKYAEGQAKLTVPAPIPPELLRRVQELALAAFRAIDCAGMARVDFFLEGDRVLVNEINTIPGFTATSGYARMWEASGLAYPDLLERLIELALERHREKGGAG